MLDVHIESFPEDTFDYLLQCYSGAIRSSPPFISMERWELDRYWISMTDDLWKYFHRVERINRSASRSS